MGGVFGYSETSAADDWIGTWHHGIADFAENLGRVAEQFTGVVAVHRGHCKFSVGKASGGVGPPAAAVGGSVFAGFHHILQCLKIRFRVHVYFQVVIVKVVLIAK